MNRPLLVVDGDSFAHRAYHGLPKSIRRHGNKGGGAILGFANFLLRLYEHEQPRAVLVGWDTLDAPTYRHRALPSYQSGREFDAELLDQLDILPQFVASCGFAYAKAPGYEADDFWRLRRLRKSGVAGPRSWRAATVTPSSSHLKQPRFYIRSALARWRGSGPPKCASAMLSNPGRCPISSPSAATRQTRYRVRAGMGPKGAASLLRRYGSLEAALADGRFAAQADQLRLYRSIATMDAAAPSPGSTRPDPDLGRGSEFRAGMGTEPAGRAPPPNSRIEPHPHG